MDRPKERFSKELYVAMQDLLARDINRDVFLLRVEEEAEEWVREAVREAQEDL